MKRLSRKIRPGRDKYKKTAKAVKGVYQNPTDAGQRAEAAARLGAAPIAGSQYV
jgi:hypothetical protein